MSAEGMMITEFQGAWRFLSNFALHPVTVWGMTWPTAEHAYQAAKSLDAAYWQQVLAVPTAGGAKRLGRAVTLRPDWELVKVPVMCEVLAAKFTSPYLASWLRSTGSALLVEGNYWHDQEWGDCYCGRAQCAPPGRNMLGLLLMAIRATA